MADPRAIHEDATPPDDREAPARSIRMSPMDMHHDTERDMFPMARAYPARAFDVMLPAPSRPVEDGARTCNRLKPAWMEPPHGRTGADPA